MRGAVFANSKRMTTTVAGVPIPAGWERKRLDTFGTSGTVTNLTALHALYKEAQWYNASGDLVTIPNTVINSEQQTYSHFEDVIAFSADHLTIQGRGHVDNSITSGEMVSKYYARSFIFECRTQVPITSGSWAAVWAYANGPGNDNSELDVEFPMVIGSESFTKNQVFLFNHGDTETNFVNYHLYNDVTNRVFYDPAFDCTSAPHNYTIVYDDAAGTIARYIDGVLIYTANWKWNASFGGTGFGPDANFILNLATGGSWPGTIATPSAYTGDMNVYWIGYYAPKSWAITTPVQTWGANHTSSITLSGGNLIATATADNVDQEVFGLLTFISGKYYWELILSYSSGSDAGGGIGNDQSPVGGGEYLGGSANGVGWYGTGVVANTGSVIATWASFGTGTIRLCFALDLDNHKLWGRLEAAGNWNNDVIGNQNPATNTGGLNLTGLGVVLDRPVTAAGTVKFITNTATGAFAASTWLGTPPTGFGPFGGEATAATMIGVSPANANPILTNVAPVVVATNNMRPLPARADLLVTRVAPAIVIAPKALSATPGRNDLLTTRTAPIVVVTQRAFAPGFARGFG